MNKAMATKKQGNDKSSLFVQVKNFFKHSQMQPVYFLLPAFLIYLIVIVIPTIYTAFLSLYDWDGVGTGRLFVGLENYRYLFVEDNVFWQALRNNVIWTILAMIASLCLGLLLAIMLNRKFKGRTFFRAVFYFPFILSNIVVAFLWQWIYHPSLGVFNEILSMVGMDGIGWLSDPRIALYSVFIASTWQQVGSAMILYLAGLQTIPDELYESAEVDGATKVQSFFRITIPLLKETYVIIFATTLFYSLKIYDIIYAMTGGGPGNSTQVLATRMYYQTFTANNVGIGSAISIILFIIVMIIAVPYIIWRRDN